MTGTICSLIQNMSRFLPSTIASHHHSVSQPRWNPRESLRRFTIISVLLCFLSFYQLLENEKLLLVLANRDKFLVYLERLPVLDMAIQRGKPIKSLNRDKLGRGVLFAFDETKRTLAVCASTKVLHHCQRFYDVADLMPIQLQLHMFVFDETFRTLQGQGSAIDLAPWYSQGEISILKMTFVCGSEEVALVDSNARVRIFSFVTLQFRFVSSPFYRSGLPFPSQQSLVDRHPCSFKLPPMPYTHHQMDPAS